MYTLPFLPLNILLTWWYMKKLNSINFDYVPYVIHYLLMWLYQVADCSKFFSGVGEMLDGIRSALPFQMRVHGSDSTNSCNTSPQYVQCPSNSHLRSCLNWWYLNLECCIKWSVHERADRTELMHRKVICTKVRDGNERIVKLKEGDPQGRHVIIVDDLVQSGSTLIECQVCSVSTWTHLWEMVWSNICFLIDDFLSQNSAKYIGILKGILFARWQIWKSYEINAGSLQSSNSSEVWVWVWGLHLS